MTNKVLVLGLTPVFLWSCLALDSKKTIIQEPILKLSIHDDQFVHLNPLPLKPSKFQLVFVRKSEVGDDGEIKNITDSTNFPSIDSYLTLTPIFQKIEAPTENEE